MVTNNMFFTSHYIKLLTQPMTSKLARNI